MALVEYGAIVDKMRGSIRGTTFSQAGGVEIAKGKPLPRRPTRASQRSAISLMARFGPAWRALSSATRTDWNNYAFTYTFVNSLGNAYELNGFQHFVRNSMYLALRGTAATASVPTNVGAPTLSIPTFDVNSNDLRITAYTPSFPASSNSRMSIFVPTSQSRANPNSPVMGTFLYTNQSLPCVIMPDVDAAFVSGQALRVFVLAKMMDAAGRLSVDNLQQFDFVKA